MTARWQISSVNEGYGKEPPAALCLFRCVKERAAKRWRRQCREQGLGVDVELAGVALLELTWADDDIVCANSIAKAERIVALLITELERVGLKLSLKKVAWAATSTVQGNFLQVVGQAVPRSKGLEVLGTYLCPGDRISSIKDRMQKAWQMLYAKRALLLRRRSSRAQRLRLLDSVIGASALWGLVCVPLTAGAFQLVRRTQSAMVARICVGM